MNPQAAGRVRADHVPRVRRFSQRKPANHSEPNSDPRLEEDLILARFRLRARLRAAWLQKLWNEEGGPGGNLAVTHAEIATHLLDRDSPAAEAEWVQSDPQAVARREELGRVENALSYLPHSRLVVLGQIFGLNPEESNLLQVCVAVALDPGLTRVCAYLNDHAGRPFVTDALAARLFGYGRCGIWNTNSPLFRWELISARENGPGEPRALLCDPQISGWLRGRHELDETLTGFAHYHPPRPPLASWPVRETAEFLRHVWAMEPPARARVIIHGPRGSGRKTFAAALSAELGLALLVIDSDGIEDPEWRRAFLQAQRHAYLNRCAVAWNGEAILRRVWPGLVAPFPAQFVIAEPGQGPLPVAGLIQCAVTLPAPTAAEREALWLEYLPSAKKWEPKVFRALVEQFRFRPGEIAHAAHAGARDLPSATLGARESARRQLGQLAERLECPFNWDHLVVSESLREFLRDIEFEARHRLAFWETVAACRLFPQGRGLLALFSGPPGTGKTMAAQVLAASLGYDLYRINIAAVVSKWVGETSQNLERILLRAAHMDVVLLFDEADALFGKRATEMRDAQDRFANTDTAYLLQAIEGYCGIALLTTNQKGNIDAGFLRRLRFVLEFSKPDADQRNQLWRNTLRTLTGVKTAEALAPAWQFLSGEIETTGAQIKNAVLGALFISQREDQKLSAKYLLRALERELSKEGRSLSPRDRQRILDHGQ
jgi:AAA+ superfamily predicted ATPase